MKKTLLLTGSEGFVGCHLLPLLETQYDVLCVDPRHPNPWTVESWLKADEMNWDVVVHLAANIEPVDKRARNFVDAYRDIALDQLICSHMEKFPPKKAFIYMSSSAVDFAEDPYAFVKIVGERFCQSLVEQGVPVKILRPFSGYGADQAETYPFPAILQRVLRKDNPVTVWGSGKQVRDFIHVDDLARAIVWAIDDAPNGIPVEIGTGEGTELMQLARMIWEEAWPGEKFFGQADVEKPESSPRRVARIAMARRYGFESEITLKEGIVRSLKEMKGTEVEK